MRCLFRTLPLFALVALAAGSARAQALDPQVRFKSPQHHRQAPVPMVPEPATLTAAQQLAIAPVKWPATWTAPRVPPGSVLLVPPRPDWMPQTGEYWGPFTDDNGAWGFLVGPIPPPAAAPPPPPIQRLGRSDLVVPPPAVPAPPPAPHMPVAGSVSPDGRMLVTYPDGSQMTWQFPILEYNARFTGLSSNGSFQLTDASGRHQLFTLARNARITLNGQPAALNALPIGAHVRARALALAPTMISVLDVTR